MSMFGDDNQDAEDLYDLLVRIVEMRGLAYLLEYLGKCLEHLTYLVKE